MLSLIAGFIIGFMKRPWKQAAMAGVVLGLLWTVISVVFNAAGALFALNPMGALMAPVLGVFVGIVIVIAEVIMGLLGWIIGKIVAKYVR
jgi:hypothetical protein